MFRFPGSFHPPLIRELLGAHPGTDLVGDPLVGSGTTALISVSMGVDALVGDIDPLACLVTRGKTTPIEPDVLRALVGLILDQAAPLGYQADTRLSPEDAINKMESSTQFRAPLNVFHWFHRTVARDLACILNAAHDVLKGRPQPERDAVMTVLASTIRRVSRADPQPVSGLEVTAVQQKLLAKGLRFDVEAEIWNRTEALAQGYEELLSVPKLGRAKVVRSDVRKWSTVCRRYRKAPLIQVLSPPYLNAIEYWRRHRLEYFWLGLMDYEEYAPWSHKFLGARVVRAEVTSGMEDGLPKEVLDLASAMSLEFSHSAKVMKQYFLDAVDWLGQLQEVAEQAGKDAAVYVIAGPSRMRGQLVDTPGLIAKMAESVGLSLVSVNRHSIVNQRMQFPLRNDGGIRTETVLRFEIS